MDRIGLNAEPGFFLLAAALYYWGGGAAVTAFFTAALVHELGHLTALYLSGGEVRRLCLGGTGLVIEYAGALTRRQEMGVTAAGPLAGLVFAAACFMTGSPYFHYTGAVAMLASMFNLLPVMPMDGGRLAMYILRSSLPEEMAAAILRAMGAVFGLGAAVTGAAFRSPAAAAAGIWLAALANGHVLRYNRAHENRR